MKKLFVLSMAFVIGFSLFRLSNADTQNNIKLIIDGNTVNFNEDVVIENNTVLVPYAVIGEEIGAASSWDNAKKKATIKKEGITVDINIGSSVAVVNGKRVALETPSKIINNRTMVPLRFVAESLDYSVDWNSDSKTILLNKNAQNNQKDTDNAKDLEFEIISSDSNYKFLGEYIAKPYENVFKKLINKDGYTYAIIAYGKRSSGGYRTTIESVKQVNGVIKVKSILYTPREGAVTMVLSYPMIVVRFYNPKELPIEFEMTESPRGIITPTPLPNPLT